ncbi:MAG: pyridoxal phosphate-dependent class II aminotransferase [Desulfosarcinaceae bacterium]
MIGGHGGNIFALASTLDCLPAEISDFSSNINPLGMFPEIELLLGQNLQAVMSLPEVDNRRVIRAFSAHYHIPEDRVLAGNGTTQFIYALPKALKTEKALILAPTYSDYADGCRLHGVSWEWLFASEDEAFNPDLAALSKALDRYDTVYICNPNNPTGCLVPGRSLLGLCQQHPETRFIIDESYLPFAVDGQDHSLLHSDLANVVVLHSLSKIFGIPGLRVGFIKAAPSIIKPLEQHLPPWSVNTLAQVVAGFLLSHDELTGEFIMRTRDYLASERRLLVERLHTCEGLSHFPGAAPFILFRLPDGLQASGLCRQLASQRILIRDCTNFIGLDDRFFRVSLKSPEANRLVSQKIIQWFGRQDRLAGGNR